MKLFLSVCVWRVIKRYSWFCVMAIDAGQAFERDSVEPFFDKIPVYLWEYRLADFGVRFRSHRSNGARLLEIEYSFSAGDESAVGDG